jgi:HEAT repeat protein
VTVDEQSVAKLLALLDDDNFDVREKATHDLAGLGKAAEPFLQAALKKTDLSAEVKERIQRVLTALAQGSAPTGEIRARRAIEALEHMDAPEVRELLQALAKGAADNPLTRDAKAALTRLDAHHAP